jgi:hypothetical protein
LHEPFATPFLCRDFLSADKPMAKAGAGARLLLATLPPSRGGEKTLLFMFLSTLLLLIFLLVILVFIQKFKNLK